MLRRKQRQLVASIVTFILLAIASVALYMLPAEVGPGTGGLGLIYGLAGTVIIILDIIGVIFLVASVIEGIHDWIERGPR